MKALQLTEIGRPLELREIPKPVPGPGDVLVKVRAAGICHSDVHYCDGLSSVGSLPHTLGHEVAGEVEALGANVRSHAVGDRVALHYLMTCGVCLACRSENEQFCVQGKMLGKDCAGGYAEYVCVPAWNAIHLSAEVSFEQGAISMCSSATAFHALRKGRMQPGETVAIFGAGGLGMSALQLAHIFGALDVYAVDLDADRLARAKTLGAIPVHASADDPVRAIRELTGGRGVDVSLELIGLPDVMRQTIQVLAPQGRAVLVGLSARPLQIDTYREVLCREAEIIGCSDHLRAELVILLDLVRQGRLDLGLAITRSVSLAAKPVNEALDNLRAFGGGVRTVIVP